MEKSLIEEEQIEDLKQYFKKVHRCRLCKAFYGMDSDNEVHINICPKCEKKIEKGEMKWK